MTLTLTFLFLVGVLAFVAAQGAIIFATAFGLTRFVRISKRWAMLAAYSFWATVTIAGYVLLAAGMGIMDGFGAVLALCFTAFVSASIYSWRWTKSRSAS